MSIRKAIEQTGKWINAREYTIISGHLPLNDDLDRVNCNIYNEGHKHCGVCSHCGKPRTMCAKG